MFDYSFVQMTNKDNKDIQGYELRCDDEPVETFLYNADKISAKELAQKKKEFFNFICSKYSDDIDRQSFLMIFAYTDDDMLEYYKEQYPIQNLSMLYISAFLRHFHFSRETF